MAKATIRLELPHFDPTSENQRRVKDLLLHALEDMVTNNGHLIEESRDYALAKLILEAPYGEDDITKQLAKEAEVS